MEVDKDIFSLIMRTRDIGDGWRQCSDTIWKWLGKLQGSEFVELDADKKRIRITESGSAVCRFLFKKGGA